MTKRRGGRSIPYDNEKPCAAFMLVMHEASIGLIFIVGVKLKWVMTQEARTTAEPALHYRGLGGWATNKQIRLWLPKTLLATIISNLT